MVFCTHKQDQKVTGQGISSNEKVPFGIVPKKCLINKAFTATGLAEYTSHETRWQCTATKLIVTD